MTPATLYIFSGLPGVGKTTISRRLASRMKAMHLRIDTIEQGLRDLCGMDVQAEGYVLAYRIAEDNLRLGISVAADSCNPIDLTRREWERVAVDSGGNYVNIEVICSDLDEHQRRVEKRGETVDGLEVPSWEEVRKREYHTWAQERIVIDTAGKQIAECVDELFSKLVERSIISPPGR